ncbi:Immunoglobulin superfamily DCC subclass member 3, partial [Takifugu flavidus]
GCLASELSFLLEPSDVIAVRERQLMLDCRVQGEEPIMITWRRNGVPLPTSPRVQVLTNGTLLIQSFQKRKDGNDGDIGEYDCAAQNRYGMLVSRKAKVLLASLPKFHTHPTSMSVDEGGVARLQCQINGIPEANISWERNRVSLNTTDSRYTLLPNGVLQVTGVRRVDAGIFRCVASNIANTRFSHEAVLNVTGGAPRIYKEPVILSGPQNLTINVHQTAILECIATGNPRPIVSWSRLDGRSIGVEGIQVLGTGNLMISDVSLQHSGVYVCAANRPGTRMRRTAVGRLVVQAPPEFIQWPQSVSKPAGGSAVFTCVAQGVPEPHLVWLKNGKVLMPGHNVRLTNNNSTLVLTRISSEDEAIYQCIAENSAGTNQASARLAVAMVKDLPAAPEGLTATPLSTNTLHISWREPPPNVTDGIIGYVLHIRKIGEPDSLELQEAISKGSFQHDVNNLEEGTTYLLYLKAYSPLGASQQSHTVVSTTLGGALITITIIITVIIITVIATTVIITIIIITLIIVITTIVISIVIIVIFTVIFTIIITVIITTTIITVTFIITTIVDFSRGFLHSVPAPPTFYIRVLNSTSVQVVWELPSKAGKAEGFRLSYRRVPHTIFQGPIQLPFHVNAYTITNLEAAAVYEMKLVAFNGNGESDCSKRLVSLGEGATSNRNDGEKRACQCSDEEASLGSVVIGIHIGTACIIFCVLFLVFGYRHSKGSQGSWSVPRNGAGHDGVKDRVKHLRVEPSLQEVCPSQCQVIIEHSSSSPGQGTG